MNKMRREQNRFTLIHIVNMIFNSIQEVSFDHTCLLCGHKIATHEYTFSVGDEFQEYSMNCMLCGYGEDSASFMPDDPRKAAQLF